MAKHDFEEDFYDDYDFDDSDEDSNKGEYKLSDYE